ncbi:hypothetical protein [Hymenobacter sp. YC55]|uniref:hypothetical protein n=1 Tax=Hymenobacter sp. YC55 TaxID=3034019 RepID=UPI0023F67414|nr:hypothetical protein [Hymenobacter sp. YC55]MDF7815896.1 hypothetical protein [Hymenobacter sp. YC55]
MLLENGQSRFHHPYQAAPTAVLAAGRHRRWRLTLGGGWAFRAVLRPRRRRANLRLTRVGTGNKKVALAAAGTVSADQQEVIVSAIQSTIRRASIGLNATVQPGQTLVDLDKEQAAPELARFPDEQLRNQNKKVQLRMSLKRSLNDVQSPAQAQQVQVNSRESARCNECPLLQVDGTPKAMRQAGRRLPVACLDTKRQQLRAASRQRGRLP